MDLVDRPAVRVVGLELVAPYIDLRTGVPRLRARAAELPAPPLVEVTTDLGTGTYRVVLGTQVGPDDEAPAGQVALDLPAGRYVHEQHHGPLDELDVTFARMHGFATQVGVQPDGVKLDVGHGAEGPHALFLRYAVI